MKRERILVAMSGGVDSAVAAALLSEAGHDVVGVTLHLWDASGQQQVGRCCAPEDRDDARRVAEYLGIRHYVVDERDAFRRHVVEPFIDSYLGGTTPSPCVHCNRTVKLEFLTRFADQLGASRVATGHYARLDHEPSSGRTRLFRGRDHDKDQSYFLFGVSPKTLDRLVFPLGDLTKADARAEGRRLGVPNADKPDSQELCFVPDGDVRSFVAGERGISKPGPIRDAETGVIVGRHHGIASFTVGQRRGLGLGGGPPRYVLRIVPERDEVVVGAQEALLTSDAVAEDVTWVRPRPAERFAANVRVRYRHRPAPAEVTPTDHGFDVRFLQPQRAVTPGQAMVVYDGEEVVGGGFIRRATTKDRSDQPSGDPVSGLDPTRSDRAGSNGIGRRL